MAFRSATLFTIGEQKYVLIDNEYPYAYIVNYENIDDLVAFQCNTSSYANEYLVENMIIELNDSDGTCVPAHIEGEVEVTYLFSNSGTQYKFVVYDNGYCELFALYQEELIHFVTTNAPEVINNEFYFFGIHFTIGDKIEEGVYSITGRN